MTKIEYTNEPLARDVDFITDKISQETPEYGDATPFAFFIRDDENKIIAGANGFVIYGAVYTDQLWVCESSRGQGLARKIMNKVHELGKSEGCSMATVQTMSFQGAQSFYEKLGYAQDFKRSGHLQNSSCIFMKKILP